MTKSEFIADCNASVPSDSIKADQILLALFYDKKDDRENSHNTIQDINGHFEAAIHAYLHRKEGDFWNADYWYRKAGSKRKDISFEQEWFDLVDRYFE